MTRPKSIIGELLRIGGALFGVAGFAALGFAYAAQPIVDSSRALIIATGLIGVMLVVAILFGIAEVLDAVVRTAAACEELARLERENASRRKPRGII